MRWSFPTKAMGSTAPPYMAGGQPDRATQACILFVAIVASLLSIRRVLVLEPAAVFRG